MPPLSETMMAARTLDGFVKYVIDHMPEDLFIGLPRAFKLRKMIVTSLNSHSISSVEELGDVFVGNATAVGQVRGALLETLPSDAFGREFLETLLFFLAFARSAANIAAWEAKQKKRADEAARKAQRENQVARERDAAEEAEVRAEIRAAEAEKRAAEWKEEIDKQGKPRRSSWFGGGGGGGGSAAPLVELATDKSMASTISSSRLQRSTRRRSTSMLQRLVKGNDGDVSLTTEQFRASIGGASIEEEEDAEVLAVRARRLALEDARKERQNDAAGLDCRRFNGMLADEGRSPIDEDDWHEFRSWISEWCTAARRVRMLLQDACFLHAAHHACCTSAWGARLGQAWGGRLGCA